MEQITLTIDGRPVTCREDRNLLEVALANGFDIPHLCYDPSLKPYGACRLCLVEDEKSGRLTASCVTPVAEGMSVLTATPRVLTHRRNIVRLMLAEHPESCILCSKGNRCRLRDIAASLGIGETGLYPMPHYKPLEQANPFLVRDLSKCILCGKCIRADHELVVVGAIDYNHRGFDSRPATLHETPLEESSCTFCGTCMSLCPTGALSLKTENHAGTPQQTGLTVCGFCGVGCLLSMGAYGGKIVETNPGHRAESVNGATLCVRGHFANDFLNTAKRITRPMLRKEGELVPVSWDDALQETAEKLNSIRRESGPQSIAFLGSTKCTNEENYLFQKMARVCLGTNHVDTGAYVNGRTVQEAFDRATSGAFRTSPLSVIRKADTLFVLGADPAHSAPVVSYELKRAARGGTSLLIADPRRTLLTPLAELWLPVLPGRDVDLLLALSAVLWTRGQFDLAGIQGTAMGFESLEKELTSLDAESLADASGVSMDQLEAAADILRGRSIAFIVGHGITQQARGVQAVQALINFSALTGSLSRPETGFIFLSRENNQVGSWDMGGFPSGLPGRAHLEDDSARKAFGRAWKTSLSPDSGMNVVRMIEEAESGRLKALYIMGENPVRSLPGSRRIVEALGNLDFLVVQDILQTETADLAHVVLPGAPFSEKPGSFTNMEGRIQTFEPVVSPPGEAKPDWEILDGLSERLKKGEGFGSLESIRAEIRRLVPSYGDLGRSGAACWTGPSGDGSRSVSLSPVLGEEIPLCGTDGERPFTAVVGSLRYHLGSGTRTGLSPRIAGFNGAGWIELGVDDAEALQIGEGDLVTVKSSAGSLAREVKIVRGLRKGMIFIPTGYQDNAAMDLFDLIPLDGKGAPGWKTCAVNVKKSQ